MIFVNIEKVVRLQTDLIVENDLLQIFEKLEHIFIVLVMTSNWILVERP